MVAPSCTFRSSVSRPRRSSSARGPCPRSVRGTGAVEPRAVAGVAVLDEGCRLLCQRGQWAESKVVVALPAGEGFEQVWPEHEANVGVFLVVGAAPGIADI